jgi:hypothetical protein
MNEIDILVRTCIIFTVLAQALRQNFYSTLSTKDFLTIFSGTRGDKIVLETVTSMRWYSRISPQTTDEKGPKKQFHGDTRNWSTEKRGMNSDTDQEELTMRNVKSVQSISVQRNGVRGVYCVHKEHVVTGVEF